MKNIAGVAFLILVTAQLGTTFEILSILSIAYAIGIDYVYQYTEAYFATNCPGICLTTPLVDLCPIIYKNAGCSSSSYCCMFSLHVEINLPNVTEPTPLNVARLTVKIPVNFTTTMTDKETYFEDNIKITTNVPSTTYTTTEVTELKTEEYTTEENYVQDKDNISCSGVCIESRLTKYCEAYLSSTDHCRSGKLCCVTKSSFGNSLPLDLVVPLESQHSTKQLTTTTTTTTTSSSLRHPEQSSNRECPGECKDGIFLLRCDNIDKIASCPDGKQCCITSKATNMTTTSPTTLQ